MPFCAQCGSEYLEGAKFCSNCGRPFGDGPSSSVSAAPVDAAEIVRPRIRTNLPDFVKKTLHHSEQVLATFSASLFDHRRKGEFRHDKFVLTNERIIYYHTGIVHKGMGEMPYKTLTGVSYNRGWVHGKVIVEAANAGLTIDRIGNEDAAFAERIIAGFIAGRKFAVPG